jgi:alpha-L-fucosidase 2
MAFNEKKNYNLWYKKPAKVWEEAIPIGNGYIGAMVFGGIKNETINLNEDSLWYGSKRDRNNYDSLENLEKIRNLIFEGKIKEAENLVIPALTGNPEHQRHYEPLGDIFIDFNNHEGKISDYNKNLNLNKGICDISYKNNGYKYEREIFANYTNNVLVINLKSEDEISFRVVLKRGKFYDKTLVKNNDTLIMLGQTGGDGVKFSSALKILTDEVNVKSIGEYLTVEKTKRVTLLLTAGTTFRHKDPTSYCLETLKEAQNVGYDTLKKNHIEDYEELFNRTDFSLEQKDNSFKGIPLDERLLNLDKIHDDLELAELYFQYGRYLLISSSRMGSLPANLQGIWNKDMDPPWGSKYTININTQMNYWPAEVCNLSECHIPLFEHIKKMVEPGKKTAKVMYGCRGFVAHHNTDIWADTAPQDIWMPATYWCMGGAWLCLHMWEHYEFTQDKIFLKEHYEIMKEALNFIIDFLVEDENKNLVTCPSISPENTYKLENGQSGSICKGPSMDTQIIIKLIDACYKSSKILDVDEGFRDEILKIKDKLPKPSIGKYGQIMEWSEDYDEVEPGHRHISQLFGLYPADIIDLLNTPELAKAAKATINRRLKYGGGHTGWSRAWIINLWARLGEGNLAYENFMALFTKSTLPNMLDSHPPFQIDGNFGGISGIAEMLLQSQLDKINLLPALPDKWKSGYIRGLKARGGFLIDIYWYNNKLKKAYISCNENKLCRVYYKDTIKVDTEHKIVNEKYKIVEFLVEKSKKYKITLK